MPNHDINVLTQENFPKQLLELPDPPEKLWLRGSLPPPDHKFLTVVGSRALSRYGSEACKILIEGLSGYPVSIVSGLALGADACAHRAALSAGLHTIAMPGSGLNNDIIGPRTNFSLSQQILIAGGALLSENEPAHIARPHDFPSRNRIMVGLADAVLVIEAGENSGSLITARLATEYNRDLLCIPHRIGDQHGYGVHHFARLGAALVTEPKHILEALHIEPRDQPSPTAHQLNGNERSIYELLAEPKSRDEIIRIAKLSPSTVLTTLITLELRGILKEEFGAWRRT